MQYIKVKNEYDNAQCQLKEGEFLHKNELISDDDYNLKKTNYYTAQLSLIQAKDTLTGMLKQLDVKGVNLYDLKIEDIEKINSALHLQDDAQELHILSSAAGTVLLPVKADGGNAEKKISKGDQVKQGDVLALIGDMSSFAIHINVNEFDVNQLKVGQKVKVTGAAFSDFILQGVVANVEHQAQMSQSGLPIFSVEIVVPQLKPEEQAVIHVGMSAKVEVGIEEAAQITVPLNAVKEKQGKTYVTVQDAKTRETHEVLVKTGRTTLDSVVILSGLKAGDNVVATGWLENINKPITGTNEIMC